MSSKKFLISNLMIVIWLISLGYSYAEPKSASKQNSTKKRISTLWSDKKDCFGKGAVFIAIETFGETYKVAACAKYGCRIAVKEFGKKTHLGDFRRDPKFIWFTDTEFETQINGNTKRFYHCPTQ